MGTNIFCVVMVTLCVWGTADGRLKLPGINLSLNDVLNDMSDRGVECTGGSVKYKYADSLCNYLECSNNKYVLRRCPDGTGVTEAFKLRDASSTNPCSQRISYCRKSLTEKGVDELVTEVCGLDLLFVLDMSFSISFVNKVKIRSFVTEMVKKLRLGDAFTQVAGSTYGANTDIFLKFSTYNTRSLILDAISKMDIDPKKGTATYLALQEAREVHLRTENGRRVNKTSVCLVMTDGITYPNDKSPDTIQEAKRLKDPKSYEKWVSPPKVILITLPNSKEDKMAGVSQEERNRLERIKTEEFSAIPSGGNGFRYDLSDFNQLQSVITPILQSSCEIVN